MYALTCQNRPWIEFKYQIKNGVICLDQKEPLFEILTTISLEVNMITKEMNIDFLSSIRLVYLIFAFQDFQNSTSGVPHLLCVLVCKIHFYLTFIFYFQFDTFSSDSGPGMTRQQFKKILIQQKSEIDTGKLTLESKHYADENLCNY